jgi:DNA adenine methylase
MRAHIVRASRLLTNRTQIACKDYLDVLRDVKRDDVVYMDPPYQGVCGERDQRYISKIAFDVFVEALRNLNDRRISYILSYDGRTGSKKYGRPLPRDLSLTHIEVDAGRSTQSTLLGRNARTYESIYLSPSLVAVLEKLTPTNHSLEPQEQLIFAEAL